jgi:hypothetical protein
VTASRAQKGAVQNGTSSVLSRSEKMVFLREIRGRIDLLPTQKSEIAVPEENLTPDEPYNISALGSSQFKPSGIFWLVVVQKWNGYGLFGGIRFVGMG